MDIKKIVNWKIGLVVVTAVAVAGLFFLQSDYYENYKINRERMERIQTQMAEANPQLLENLKSANETLNKELQKTPDKPDLWYELGANKKHLGDYIGAEKAFKKAVELDKESITSLDSLGLIYQELGKYAQAEDAFRQMIQRQPLYQEGYMRLAELYETGEYKTHDEAETILLTGINLDIKSVNKNMSVNPLVKPLLLSLAEYYDMIGADAKAAESRKKLKDLGFEDEGIKTPTLITP